MPVEFHKSTPPAARQAIGEWLAIPDLDRALRAAVERLAMSDLWTAIPPEPPGMEAVIIGTAVVAYSEALSLQPPLPRSRAALAEHLQRYKIVPTSYAGMATLARKMGDDLATIPSFARANWAAAWPGDPGIDFDKLLAAVGAIAACCDQLGADGRAAEAALQLPKPPRRRGAVKAQQTYFGRIVSDRLQRLYDRPIDRVATILEDVMFDLGGGNNETTARSRRRSPPAHSADFSSKRAATHCEDRRR
jgi:hypothetical protein